MADEFHPIESTFWSETEVGSGTRSETRRLRFELDSRGHWVPGRLDLPPSAHGALPLVLVQHGAGSSKDDPILTPVVTPWVERGAAVARIDLPLHGERRDPKLSARVLAAVAPGASPSALDQQLWTDLHEQVVADLRRTVAALSARPEIDPGRIGFVGFSLGAMLGAAFCAAEPQIRAIALALGGAGIAPAPFDPLDAVARISPRPLLLVNTRGDERVPAERAEALHAAAREPKEVAWYEGGHRELPGIALKRIWLFLSEHLPIPSEHPVARPSGGV